MTTEPSPPEPRPAVPPVAAAPIPASRRPDREIGETRVRPAVGALLCALFLAVIGGVPAAELSRPAEPGVGPWRSLLGGLGGRLAEEIRGEGLLAANRALLAEMSLFEDQIEEESMLVATVVPHARAALMAGLGVAGPEVYPGREGWLFYRPDVEHVTGPGFLEPAVLAARAREGDAWAAPPAPDPRPALMRFRDDLAARGIALVVMPTPVKPAVHPERLSARLAPVERPLANRSSAALEAALSAAGISVFDPGPALMTGNGEAAYLVGDTHWTPDAVDRVAAGLARHLAGLLTLSGSSPAPWSRGSVTVEGSGDTARILELPAWGERRLVPRQRVEILQVTGPDGALWRPDPEAPVLLLGDSFTNVFSQADLGWGVGAGLAEQLAYHLGHPVDRLARNAGGAFASREELARALARGEDRLGRTEVVVLQFATRELSFGDWRVIPLPEDDEGVEGDEPPHP